MTSLFGMSFIEKFVRSKKIQQRYFLGMGSMIAVFQYAPELCILMGYDNVLHAELGIIPITQELQNEYERLCTKANIDPNSIVMKTWSRDSYKIIGSSWLYKLFGLKSILCVPALHESTYVERRSRGYSRLTIGHVQWKSSIGSLAEVYYVPNIMEKCFGISGQLAIHKYNTWLVASTFCLLSFMAMLCYFSLFFMRKGFYLLIIPVPMMASFLVQGPLWSLYLRMETYLADSYVIRKFPELLQHGKTALVGPLFFRTAVKIPGNKEGRLGKYFYEDYRLSKLPNVNRLKRLNRHLQTHSQPTSNQTQTAAVKEFV